MHYSDPIGCACNPTTNAQKNAGRPRVSGKASLASVAGDAYTSAHDAWIAWGIITQYMRTII